MWGVCDAGSWPEKQLSRQMQNCAAARQNRGGLILCGHLHFMQTNKFSADETATKLHNFKILWFAFWCLLLLQEEATWRYDCKLKACLMQAA